MDPFLLPLYGDEREDDVLLDANTIPFLTVDGLASSISPEADSTSYYYSPSMPARNSPTIPTRSEVKLRKKNNPEIQLIPKSLNRQPMERFSCSTTLDWKHVLYNLLVDDHNSSDNSTVFHAVLIRHAGEWTRGFVANQNVDADFILADLYAQHTRFVFRSTI